MARDNVTYIGQRKTGGKATNDTPMHDKGPELTKEMASAFYDLGEVVDRDTVEYLRSRKGKEDRT